MKRIIVLIIFLLFIFSLYPEGLVGEFFKDGAVPVMLYSINYDGPLDKLTDGDRILSIERNVTEQIKSGLIKTGKFKVINTLFSDELIKDVKSTQQGLTENKERLVSDFSKYVISGHYVDSNGKIFLSLYLMDISNGQIIFNSFDESDGNSSSIYETAYSTAFNLAGLSYQKKEINSEEDETSIKIEGYVVKIFPEKGISKSILMTNKRHYEFFGSTFKLPPLVAGEYTIITEQNRFYTNREVIFIENVENKIIEIYLQEKLGTIALNIESKEEYNSTVMMDFDKEKIYDFESTLLLKKQKIGSYKFKITKELYYPLYKTVKMPESVGTVNVPIDLKVKPVNVLFYSNVRFSKVYVDDVFYGVAPFVAKVPDGKHEITYKKFFYYPTTVELTVKTPEYRIIEGSLEPNIEQMKLLREIYPHFFITSSFYGGLYSSLYLSLSPERYWELKKPDDFFSNFATFSLDLSMGMDFEYFFFGVKGLFTFYYDDIKNKSPEIKNTNIDFDFLPYIGFKLYPDLYTSFDFGFAIDLSVFTAKNHANEFTWTIEKINGEYFSYLQNYMALAKLTFYNRYKREVFSFSSMLRFDFIDQIAHNDKKVDYKHPVQFYFGITLPFVYTSSENRMDTKDYSVYINRNYQQETVDDTTTRLLNE